MGKNEGMPKGIGMLGPAMFALFLLLLDACSHAPPKLTTLPWTDTPPAYNDANTDGPVIDSPSQKAREEYLKGDYPRATSHLETVLFLRPNSSDPWNRYLLYYCYLITGRYQEALETAKTLIKLDAFQPLPYTQLGLAELWLGHPDIAVQNLSRALDFESHLPRTHFYLALAYAALGQNDERDRALDTGVKEYEEILKRNPDDFTANYELAALLLYWNRQLGRASGLLEKAQENFLKDGPAGHLGLDADAQLSANHQLYSQYYLPLLEGILLYRSGNAGDAVQRLLQASLNLPSGAKADAAEMYFYLGSGYQKLGNTAAAKNFFRESMQNDPTGPYAKTAAQGIL